MIIDEMIIDEMIFHEMTIRHDLRRSPRSAWQHRASSLTPDRAASGLLVSMRILDVDSVTITVSR
jgi:hypothetical protein